MIVRLTGGQFFYLCAKRSGGQFLYFFIFKEEYSFEIDDFNNFLVTFGDVPIKFEQTQYQNETLHCLLQRHVFASTLQLSSEEKNQFIFLPGYFKNRFCTLSIELKFFCNNWNLC